MQCFAYNEIQQCNKYKVYNKIILLSVKDNVINS